MKTYLTVQNCHIITNPNLYCIKWALALFVLVSFFSGYVC